MDKELLQQLSQVFQQGLKILQNAGAAGGDDDEDDEDLDTGADMDDDEDEDDEGGFDMDGGDDDDDEDEDDDADDEDDEDDADEDDDMEDDDEGGDMPDNLHDRISKLEQHTGLKKFAKSGDMPLVLRLDNLEEHYLGETYEGTPYERTSQLEGYTGTGLAKSASPNVIPLDSLIKSAIGAGSASDDDYPSPASLRKSAVRYGTSRRSTHAIASDDDLTKAAESWGYDEDELDEPIGLADLLRAQIHAKDHMADFLPMADDD